MQDMRLQHIIAVVKEKSYASVEELAAQLNVSAMTIRRDLNLLCSQGRLERCYGGARLPSSIVRETAYSEKLQVHREQKLLIARKALSFIQSGDSLYLDSGTTVGALAQLLCESQLDVSVVTNELNIAQQLAQAGLSVTMVGGTVNQATGSVSGHASEQFLRQFRFSKAFLGASSIDYSFNTFSPNFDKAYLKRLAMELSAQCYLLADAGKFYSSAMCLITSLNQYAGVITDKEFSKAELKQLQEKSVNIIPAADASL